MLRSLLSIVLFLVANQIGFASIVPYEKDLSPTLSELQNRLKEVEFVDTYKALELSRSLYVNSSTSSINVRAWALNVYCEQLLANDSIYKAEALLLDSNLVDWANVEEWIQKYHELNLGLSMTYKGRYKQADTHIKSTLAGDIDRVLELHATQALAENLRYQGKLNLSLSKWYEALTLSEEIGDSSEIVIGYLGRGIVRFLTDDLTKAEEDITIYFKFNKRIGNEKSIAYGLSLLGLLDYKKGDFESSIKRNLDGYDIRIRINDIKGQGESLNNLALGYMGLKNWNQALLYLEQAAQIKTQANDLTQMTVILNNMGHCHSRLKNISQALKYFNLALDKGIENGQMGDVKNSYRNIIQLHTKKNSYKEAFETQLKLDALKDSLATAERTEAVQELEVKFETEKKEQEITLLQQDRTIITNRWLTLALGLFLAIIIGVLFIDNQKRKHRQEKELLLKEDELQKSELKNLADQLEFNQNKLSLYMDNLLKKNELVGQLESRLKDSVDSFASASEDNKQLIADFSSVRILTDDDWEEFKTLFNGVHQGMLERLLRQFSDLTLGEQRLFLLMKLSLSTKEIANILGVSPESIKKARYRLKKKLAVEDMVSLQDFIEAF